VTNKVLNLYKSHKYLNESLILIEKNLIHLISLLILPGSQKISLIILKKPALSRANIGILNQGNSYGKN
jgi:hypothetical protein